jgi:Lon protease-like protein
LVSLDSDDDPGDLAVEIANALAQLRKVRELWAELGEGPALPEQVALGADFSEQIWRLCSATPLGPLDRQRLLESNGLRDRLALLAGEIADRQSDFEAMLEQRP